MENIPKHLKFSTHRLVLRITVVLPFVLLFLIFGRVSLYGQTSMDSLLNEIRISEDFPMVRTLSIDANAASLDEPKTAINLSLEALKEAKKNDYLLGLIYNYRLLGNLYYHLHRYEDAIQSYDQCIGYAQQESDSLTIRECYLNKGVMFFTKGLYSKALDNYMLALEYSERYDKELEYLNIGAVFYYEKEYEMAYDYYSRTLEIMKSKGNQYGISVANNNIGDVYKMTGKYKVALIYYKKALNISRQIEDKEVMTYLNNIGEMKSILNQRDSAIYYFKLALSAAEEQDNELLTARSLYFIGQEFFNKNNFAGAKVHLLRSYDIAKSITIYPEISNAARLLTKIYESEGDFGNAYKYGVVYKMASDSLYNNKAKRQVLKIMFDYKIKLQELESQKLIEIEKVERKKSIYRLSTIIFILIILLLIGILLLIKVKLRMKFNLIEREKADLKRESMERELEFKNREIIEKVLSITEKNELIGDAVTRLRKVVLNLPQSKRAELERIIKDIKSNEVTNQWDEFHFYFTRIYSKFYEKLEKDYPDLTANERRLCAFLKLNMTSKDIATLTYQNYKSIEVARTRLRKRFNLTNSNVGFQEFFSQFN